MSLSLYQSERYFYIKSVNFIDQGERTLILDRTKSHIFEVKDNELLNSEKNKITEGSIFGVVGIMNIIGHNYLCIIKDAQIIGKLYGAHIYKVTDVKLFPFYMNMIHNVGVYIDELKKTLCEGFYFSYGYDLTASRQRRIKFLQERSRDMLRIIACDHRFFWNINLYKDFKDQHVDVRWYTPLVQGYMGIVNGKISGREIQISLISRRSHMRSGTRYNARGIDDSGNVANFVETEQMIQMENIVFSYVMIRGSVPVFWEQKGMVEDVTISRGSDMTKKAFHLHFQDIFTNYQQIFVVDLLSDKKQREIKLTKEYVKQLQDCAFKERIKFLHFDFHHYCKGDKYQSLKVLVGKLQSGMNDFGLFVEDVKARKIQQLQTGVFRVNCLDSLDRTNVAQSKIGLMLLQRQLQKLGFVIEESFGKDVAREGLAFCDDGKPVIRQLKHYWAEQGDYLSKQYVGTNSTISKVSRDGKEGFMGKISHKMKNVQRYFINTWSENFAQNSYDIILGKHVYSIDSNEMRNFVSTEMKKREDLYTETKILKLFVGTWNIGGVRPYEQVDLSQWLFPFKDHFIPDIMVIGFQEIVELNTSSVLLGKGNANNVKMWNDHIASSLSLMGDERYVFITGENLVGIYTGLYAKKSISQKITAIATSKLKQGFSGKMGNKGAAAIRFLYQDNSFCFINCHLESGVTSVDQKKRVQQINEICQNAFIKERGTSQINYQFNQHQNKVIFGDLNYRIFLDNINTRKLIQIGDYEQLMKHDEFNVSRRESEILKNFKEGRLIFDPTYKYNFNSKEYDTSSKGRIPAWCDRVLFEENANLTQIYYGRAEIKLSDHRPVYGLFEAKIGKINEEARMQLEQELILKFKTMNQNTSPYKQEISPEIDPSKGDGALNSPSKIKKQRVSMTDRLYQLDNSMVENDDDLPVFKKYSVSLLLNEPADIDNLLMEPKLVPQQVVQHNSSQSHQHIEVITDKQVQTHQNPHLNYQKPQQQIENSYLQGRVLVPASQVQHTDNPYLQQPQVQPQASTQEDNLKKLFFQQKLKDQQASNVIRQVGLFNHDSDNEEEKLQFEVSDNILNKTRSNTIQVSIPAKAKIALFSEEDDSESDNNEELKKQGDQIKSKQEHAQPKAKISLFMQDEEDEEEPATMIKPPSQRKQLDLSQDLSGDNDQQQKQQIAFQAEENQEHNQTDLVSIKEPQIDSQAVLMELKSANNREHDKSEVLKEVEDVDMKQIMQEMIRKGDGGDSEEEQKAMGGQESESKRVDEEADKQTEEIPEGNVKLQVFEGLEEDDEEDEEFRFNKATVNNINASQTKKGNLFADDEDSGEEHGNQ